MPKDTLLTNATFQVLSRIPWQRAVILVVTNEVHVIESDPTQMIRSKHLSIPRPTIVSLKRYVHVSFEAGISRERPISKKAILLRDGRNCAYCGKHGDTIDHIIPQCRGGQNTWDNLVAACQPCNNRKADRTPVEAGMRLLWEPRPLALGDADQQRVWRVLEAV